MILRPPGNGGEIRRGRYRGRQFCAGTRNSYRRQRAARSVPSTSYGTSVSCAFELKKEDHSETAGSAAPPRWCWGWGWVQKSKSRTQTFWLSWTPFCPPFWNLSQIALGFFRSEINSQPRNNNPQERRFCILRAKSDLLLALGTLRFRIKERRSQRNRWFRLR